MPKFHRRTELSLGNSFQQMNLDKQTMKAVDKRL